MRISAISYSQQNNKSRNTQKKQSFQAYSSSSKGAKKIMKRGLQEIFEKSSKEQKLELFGSEKFDFSKVYSRFMRKVRKNTPNNDDTIRFVASEDGESVALKYQTKDGKIMNSERLQIPPALMLPKKQLDDDMPLSGITSIISEDFCLARLYYMTGG
jgi:hypothetical protein